MAEEKQFKPTPKKLKEARKKGEVLKSPIITQSCVVLAVLSVVGVFSTLSWESSKILLQYSLTEGFYHPERVFTLWAEKLIAVVALALGIGVFVGVAVELFQVKPLFEFSLVFPKSERLSLAKGIKRIFSGFKRVPEIALKVALLGLGYTALSRAWVSRSIDFAVSFNVGSRFLFKDILFRSLCCGLVLLGAAGAFEYWIRRRKYYRDLSMSLDEVRRETKEEEGDPHQKSFRKAQHEALLMQDIVQRVRRAKVVIVEPDS
ncbi:MAG: hypothetical protein D6808_00120 [Candidatus Dadabacteria bacterium]|nr:MAG: hypothetical protein D6808_00120 [Candidatus Dadabacteria bacterium]